MRPVTVEMDDGTQYTGEHVGTQDSYMFLATEIGVIRLDTWRVAKYSHARDDAGG